MLRRLAAQDAPRFSAVARAAKEALLHVRTVQAARTATGGRGSAGLAAVQPGPVNRSVYDAKSG